MLEVMIVVAVIGIIAAIAMPSMGNLSNGVKETSLVSDVATINRSIQAYQATGGDLKNINDPQVVLNKLKSRNDIDAAKISTTFSGSMIDKRLAVSYLTQEEKRDSNVPRAVWDKNEMLFKIKTLRSGKGIAQFILDDSLAEIDYGTETRERSTTTKVPDGYGMVSKRCLRDAPTSRRLEPETQPPRSLPRLFNH
jgi:type II secretory pathway pseudopilin PulG